MRNLIALILLAIALNVVAQNSETVKTYYDPYSKTRIHEVYSVIVGTPTKNGSYKRYDEAGKIDAEGTYLNGNQHGIWKWYQKGLIEKVLTYNKGVLDGFCEVYDEKGEKIKTWYTKSGNTFKEILYYDKNKMKSLSQFNGLNTEWYKNGNKSSEYSMLNGKADGPSTTFYENNTIQSKGNYLQGYKVGQWESFYPGGEKRSISNFDADRTLTQEICWFRNGKIQSEKKNVAPLLFSLTVYDSLSGKPKHNSKISYKDADYTDFKSDSIVYYYDSIGENIHCTKVYKNGFRNGTWKIYYDNSFLEVQDTTNALYYRIITYDYDNIKGQVKDYFINGRLQAVADLKSDLPNDQFCGDLIIYHSNGIVGDSSRFDYTGKVYFKYLFAENGSATKSLKLKGSYRSRVFEPGDLNKTYVITLYDNKGQVAESKEITVYANNYEEGMNQISSYFSEE